MIRIILIGVSALLLMTCTGLDDQPLPADAKEKIYFSSFEIDPLRNSILGRIVNDSPYTLTSCQIEIKVYHISPALEGPLTLREVELGDEGVASLTPVMTERLLMREALRPEYSTEIYFEMRLHDLHGQAIYTREIIKMKGSVAS